MIVLSDEQTPFSPIGFYVVSVKDRLTDKAPVAQVLLKQSNGKLDLQPLELQGGTVAALKGYINRNVVKDTTLRAVSIGIKSLHVAENLLSNGNIDGHVQMTLSFGLVKDYGTEHLIDYNGVLHYIKSPFYAGSPEQQIRSALKNGLTYFNKWMKVNEAGNRKLARSVRFSFSNFSEYPEGDTIYYSASRPLTWADFQSTSKPASSAYAATVIPVIGYAERDEILNGVINVHIALKPNVQKSANWTNGRVSDSYHLNHEQRHFDIAAYIMLQFAQKIKNAHLTPDNYEAFISMQYFDSERDMSAMQKAYEKETNHGLNQDAQAKWNEKIDALLKSMAPVP